MAMQTIFLHKCHYKNVTAKNFIAKNVTAKIVILKKVLCKKCRWKITLQTISLHKCRYKNVTAKNVAARNVSLNKCRCRKRYLQKLYLKKCICTISLMIFQRMISKLVKCLGHGYCGLSCLLTSLVLETGEAVTRDGTDPVHLKWGTPPEWRIRPKKWHKARKKSKRYFWQIYIFTFLKI